MQDPAQILGQMYDRFNARDMDAVLAATHPDVVWANGLDGGHVHGHAGVREYWTRQWAAMDSRAEPIEFLAGADGTTEVRVHLIAHDLEGDLLFDATATHIFRIVDGLVTRFDIR